MTAAITALLAVIAQIAGTTGATTITSIISALTSLIPILIKEYQALVPVVTNIIDALRNNDAITPSQEAALDDLEEQYDADFEAAVAAYGAAPPST